MFPLPTNDEINEMNDLGHQQDISRLGDMVHETVQAMDHTWGLEVYDLVHQLWSTLEDSRIAPLYCEQSPGYIDRAWEICSREFEDLEETLLMAAQELSRPSSRFEMYIPHAVTWQARGRMANSIEAYGAAIEHLLQQTVFFPMRPWHVKDQAYADITRYAVTFLTSLIETQSHEYIDQAKAVLEAAYEARLGFHAALPTEGGFQIGYTNFLRDDRFRAMHYFEARINPH